MVEVRVPEAFGDEVDDALFDLEGPGDAEEGGSFGQGGVSRKDSRPEGDVDEAGLVLQRHEGDAPYRRWKGGRSVVRAEMDGRCWAITPKARVGRSAVVGAW